MSTTLTAGTRQAVRSGISRGSIEMLNSLKNPTDLAYYVVGQVVFVAVIWLNRNATIGDSDVPTALFLLPSVLAMQIVFTASYGLATTLATEREDGTLLRAKSVPHGMSGYVVGQSWRCSLEVLFGMTVTVVAATIVIDDLWQGGIVAIVSVLGLVLLGLLACTPLGFVVGSVFKNPRSVGGWGLLLMGALIYASGLFTPLGDLPTWVQWIGQVFPMYWLGLAMRGAVLPDWAAEIELGGEWRTLEAFGVLGVWAVIGLVLAPRLLRRMARRESGSAVSSRREKALQRV